MPRHPSTAAPARRPDPTATAANAPSRPAAAAVPARGQSPRPHRTRRPNALRRRRPSWSSPPQVVTPPDEYRPFFRLFDYQTVSDLRTASPGQPLLLWTPTLPYPDPSPVPDELVYGDPFIPLGRLIHESHPIVRHEPYEQARGFGPEHVRMLRDAGKVVVVVVDIGFTLGDPQRMRYLTENVEEPARDFHAQLAFAREVHRRWMLEPVRADTGREKPLLLITMGEWDGVLAAGYGVEQFQCVVHGVYRQEDWLELTDLVFDREMMLDPMTLVPIGVERESTLPLRLAGGGEGT